MPQDKEGKGERVIPLDRNREDKPNYARHLRPHALLARPLFEVY